MNKGDKLQKNNRVASLNPSHGGPASPSQGGFVSTCNSQGGFTLVEALFAVFILTLTITTFMGVVAQSLFSARYARDEITANYLLQEVADYVRNDRDTTVFLQNGDPNEGWNIFRDKYNSCMEPDGCYFDTLASPFNPQSVGGEHHYLYYHDTNSNNFYNYDPEGGVATNFERQVFFFINPKNEGEINLKITVSWKNGGLNKSKSLETSLLNWQDTL